MRQILQWGGRFLSGINGLLVVVFFFMPWILVSCGGQEVATFSGWELAQGISIGGEHASGNPFLFAILAFGFLIILVAAIPVRQTLWLGVIEMGQALLGLVLMMLVVLGYQHDRQTMAMGVIEVHYRIGFIGTIVAFMGALMGGGLMFVSPWFRDDVLERLGIGRGERGGGGKSPPLPSAREYLPPEPALPGPVEATAPDQSLPAAREAEGQAKAVLYFRQGPLAGNRIPVQGDNVLLGRGSGCDVLVPDRFVSRQHARLRYARGQWFIQDQGSTGGTYVNGQRVTATRLHRGDRVRLGQQSEFVFLP